MNTWRDRSRVRGCFRLAVLSALVIVTTTAAQQPEPGEWTVSRADLLGTGRNVSSAPDPQRGELVWEVYCKTRVTVTPIIKGGVLYVGDWSSVLYAIDTRSGALVWSTKPRISKNPPAPASPDEDLAPVLGGISEKFDQSYTFSNPTVDAERVYIATQQGIVTAFDRKDGAVVWEREYPAEIYSSLRVAEGRLLFGCNDNWFYCLDAATGEDRWKHRAADWVGGSCVVTRGGTVLVMSHDKKLHKLRLSDGTVLDQFEIGYRSTGSPAFTMGCLYFCATGRKFLCVDARTGKTRWHRPCTSTHQQGIGVGNDGQVFVAIASFFFAYDAVDGGEKWRVMLDSNSVASPAVGKELVYVNDSNGWVYGYDQKTGESKLKFEYGKASFSSPILVDGTIYTADGAGRIAAWK